MFDNDGTLIRLLDLVELDIQNDNAFINLTPVPGGDIIASCFYGDPMHKKLIYISAETQSLE
ncbi:MAG TPA: hypothetical protein VGB30_06975 [bacterium]